MNRPRSGLLAALAVMCAQAVSAQNSAEAFLSTVQALAALPGTPSIVAAAGLTRANERVVTLEHTQTTLDPARRLVIVGGLDGTPQSSQAVLEALRWFKEDAPAALRRIWTVSAIPCARPPLCWTPPTGGDAAGGSPAGRDPVGGRPVGGNPAPSAPIFPPEDGFYNHGTSPETRYVWRWVTFQAPDLVLEVRLGPILSWEISAGDGVLDIDGTPPLTWTLPPTGTLAAAISEGGPSGLAAVPALRVSTSIDGAPDMLRSLLDAAASLAPSPLRDALHARVTRTPLELATVLANRYPARPSVSYVSAVAWSNTLRLAARLGDAGLLDKVRSQMAPFLAGEAPTVTEPYRLTNLAGLFAFVDFSEPGGSETALDLAVAGSAFMFPQSPNSQSADAILRSPTGWTDDMFMASSLLSRIGGRTGDPRYGATVGQLLTSYAENLQRPDGLFVHSTSGPHAWGRANGFALLGMTEALTFLPEGWAERPRVLATYRRQVEALVAHQAPDGMWQQVVDEPGSYRELTVTAMTVAAMARGVRLGWLDDRYRPVIERAWRGVAAHIAEDGSVVDASTSTGAGPTKQYYLDRTAVYGADDRGGAMALWAAMEMDELCRGASAVPCER